MPAERVLMRRIREILRLKYEAGATDRQIARALDVARSTVALTLDRARAAGLTWLCNDNSEVRPASTTMSGEALGVSCSGSSRRGVWRC